MSYITNEMWEALITRVERLENATVTTTRLGPQEPTALELGAEARRVEKLVLAAKEKLVKTDIPPVDYGARVLADGSPVTNDHREITASGQQKDYVVLSEEERHRGFIRPVRCSYIHQKCGSLTTMGLAIAETYARCPGFYSGTFCCKCRDHFPIGEDGEFVWEDGTKVGL